MALVSRRLASLDAMNMAGSPWQPPEPAVLLLRQLAVVLLELLPQQGSSFVFALPILCAVELPVFSKGRGKGLGEKQ